MANPMDRITEARASLLAAKRSAHAALNLYRAEEDKRNPPSGKYAHGMMAANRAQTCTHLPEDMLELLGIDRYGAGR